MKTVRNYTIWVLSFVFVAIRKKTIYIEFTELITKILAVDYFSLKTLYIKNICCTFLHSNYILTVKFALQQQMSK